MATTIRNVITAEITPFARKKRGRKLLFMKQHLRGIFFRKPIAAATTRNCGFIMPFVGSVAVLLSSRGIILERTSLVL